MAFFYINIRNKKTTEGFSQRKKLFSFLLQTSFGKEFG